MILLRKCLSKSRVLLWLGAVLGIAGVVPRFTLKELSGASETIVEGRVTRAWTAWDSKHKYIWTHYEIQVADVLKGSPAPTTAPTIVVSEPGGALDGVEQLFSAQVPYSMGEHLLLFLYRTPIGYLRTRGGPQGKFSLPSDAQGNSGLSALKLRVRELLASEGR